jgi:cell division protein FtsZ
MDSQLDLSFQMLSMEIKEKLTDGFVKTLVAIQKVEDDEKDLADESIDVALTTLNNMITLIELPKAEQEAEELIELVFHEQVEAEVPVQQVTESFVPEIDEPAPIDEAEAQRNRAAERLYKLRNLSFNFNAQDPNNEYESIPAYVRHNLQVHNTTLASVEKFYSSYSVGKDENNVTQISTINTFLEGKKPD